MFEHRAVRVRLEVLDGPGNETQIEDDTGKVTKHRRRVGFFGPEDFGSCIPELRDGEGEIEDGWSRAPVEEKLLCLAALPGLGSLPREEPCSSSEHTPHLRGPVRRMPVRSRGRWRARVPSGEGAVGWRTAESTAGAKRARLSSSPPEGPCGPNVLVTGTEAGSRGGYVTHGNPRSPLNVFAAEGAGRRHSLGVLRHTLTQGGRPWVR